MVFFRKIFILQLVGLVLTYNFTDCNFKEISNAYKKVIIYDLKSYMNGAERTHFNITYSCDDQPNCLTKIEHLTFHPAAHCPSLARETFAEKTKRVLTSSCPDYSRTQINNTQVMKKRRKREKPKNNCTEIVSNLMGLWGRFIRASRKQI
uniref:Thymic stromal lymphopoietin n=1 Tax=Molossus molossus TaxID=27622 RepID=A0A7J8J4I3_MOLMO|nr:thymic stromal lymphopoietin [Molossus molossus]